MKCNDKNLQSWFNWCRRVYCTKAYFKNFVVDFFSKGHPRTIKAKKNIFASFGLKGFSILVSFLLVPLTLNYLNPTKYGIWLTISSIVGWFGFFDIGLGNGLRNKLAEALALKDYELGKAYVSTTYFILTAIIGIVYILFLFINHWLNWAVILNTSPNLKDKLSIIVLVVVAFFALRFVLKLIGVIFTADQNPAINDSFTPLGNLIALLGIFLITKISNGNLLYVSFIYSAAPVLILVFASFYFFNRKYKFLKPSLKYVKIKYFKSLAGLGSKFFLLQISAIIVFSTDNIIITQILGPAEVTPYNIAFKYFGIPIMVFTIIITPYWSAFTDAITKNDIKWIKNSINKLIKIWLLAVVGVIILLAISKYFYLMWVGDKVHIPFLLSAFMGLYAIISTWNNIFAFFLNGIGKLKLSIYLSAIIMIINIPLSIFLAKNLKLGIEGVILATISCLLIGTFIQPLQYYKIINKKAVGIWNK